MDSVSKSLIVIGAVFILSGLIWHFTDGKIPLGHLPGDIHIKNGQSNIYIPITTCLLLSGIISLISWFLRK